MTSLKDILEYFSGQGLEIRGDSSEADFQISGGKNIVEAGPDEITFLSAKFLDQAPVLISKSNSRIIVVEKKAAAQIQNASGKIFVIADDAKSEMVKALKHFFPLERTPSVHATAVIDKSAHIGKENFIGAYTVIDKNVSIGNGCIIESFVHIKANTQIGDRVKIKSGTVIGGSGFGYVQQQDQHWENFPHYGKVVIEDDVHIGSNTCIDRGALGDTILKKGVKVDNLVHIAHNVVIGENSLIIADAMIGGSAKIDENVWVAPSSAVRNGIHIGANSVIGMGAVVTKDVAEGITVAGNPAAVFTKAKSQ